MRLPAAHRLPTVHHSVELHEASVRTPPLDILRRRAKALAQPLLVTVVRDGQAVHRADVDTRIALDAELLGEHRLDIAVQAALHLFGGLLG